MGDSAAWQIGSAGVLSAVREISAGKRSSIIELVRGRALGEIGFVRGELVFARVGRLVENEAFNHLLLWGATATLRVRPNPSLLIGKKHFAVDALIEQGLRFVEALDDLDSVLGGPKTTFEPRRLADPALKLPAEVRAFAERIEPGVGLLDLIEGSSFSPVNTVKVCYRLCELGVMTRREGRAPIVAPPPKPVAQPPVPAPAPRAAPPPIPKPEIATGRRPRKDPTGEITTGRRPRKDPTGENTSRRAKLKAAQARLKPQRPDPVVADNERSVRFARFAPDPAPSAEQPFDAVDEAFFAGEVALAREAESIDRFEDLENTATRRKLARKRGDF